MEYFNVTISGVDANTRPDAVFVNSAMFAVSGISVPGYSSPQISSALVKALDHYGYNNLVIGSNVFDTLRAGTHTAPIQ